jgi:hypothetical protein
MFMIRPSYRTKDHKPCADLQQPLSSPAGPRNTVHTAHSRLEAAYHRADAAIQRIVDLLAAA